MPFDLLDLNNRRLLNTHVVSYVPSGEVLATLRSRTQALADRPALAISASFGGQAAPAAKGLTRNLFDLDPSKLRPLPLADDEARSVGTTLGAEASTVLIEAAETENALKRQPLADYRVLRGCSLRTSMLLTSPLVPFESMATNVSPPGPSASIIRASCPAKTPK